MRRTRQQLGVTLIEVSVSTALVGLVLVAALETLGGAMRTMRQTSSELKAHALAESLLAEVIALPYTDPTVDSETLGLESDESVFGSNRSLYDDLDDFVGWTNSPPQDRDGDALEDYDDWTRQVEVTYVTASSFTSGFITTNRDQGLKRVRVTVTDPAGAITEVDAIRSPYGPNEAPAPFDTNRFTALDATITLSSGAKAQKAAATTNLLEVPTP